MNGSALAVLLVALLLDVVGVYLDVAVPLGGFALDQSLLDGLPNGIEYLADVVVILGRALHKVHPVLLGQTLALLETHLALGLLAVNLVPNDDLAHRFRLRFIDLFDPVLEVVKGLAVGDTVDEDDTRCTFVVGFGDGFEPFLAGRIPYLHFDFDAVDIDGFDFEVDADGGDVRHFVLLVDVAQEDVGFPDCGVPNDDQLDQVVVLLFVPSLSHNNYKLTEIVNAIQSYH